MKHHSKLLLVFFVFSVLFSASCTKNVERKIEGKWMRVNVQSVGASVVPKDTIEYWDFRSDGSVKIHIPQDVDNGFMSTVNDICHYVINARLRRSYVYIYTDIPEYDNNGGYGVWEVIYLKKNTMMIVLRPTDQSIVNYGHRENNPNIQGGLLFREFVKAN